MSAKPDATRSVVTNRSLCGRSLGPRHRIPALAERRDKRHDGEDSLPRLLGAAAAEQKTALAERRYKAKGPQH